MSTDNVSVDCIANGEADWAFKCVFRCLIIRYNNLSAIGDCFDRYSLGVLLEPAMMAVQSLKKLLGFKSIDKPSWWLKESRKFMFYPPGVTIFIVVFRPC